MKNKENDKVNKRCMLKNITPWLFLAPSLITISVVVPFPFVDVIRRSFFSAMGREFVGFKNYISIIENQAFQLAAINTIKFTVVCIPLLLVFSLMLALMLSALKEKKGVFKTSFLIPFAIPVASMVLLWKILLHKNGMLNFLLDRIGFPPIDWLNSDWAFTMLVITYVWKNSGYNMVLWLSGISGISLSLYEAASIDGAGAFKRFRYITVPNLIPTFFTVTVLSLLNSFKVFREAYLISGSYPNDNIYLLQHIFNNWFLNLDIDKMCAGAVLMALFVLVLILLLQKVSGKDCLE